MAISQQDIKLLWGRAANRCAICKIELSRDKKSTNASFPVGEHCHIVAESHSGPRGNSIISLEERNSYHNLILLCPTHHKEIDKNVEDFPIEKLHSLKSRHELWVQETLEKDLPEKTNVLRPVSELLEIVSELAPLLFWLNRSIPPERALDFLSSLQRLWHSSIVLNGSVEFLLASGMDHLLRPISTSHFLKKEGTHYTQSKLVIAAHLFNDYFKGKGLAWRDVERDFEIETILFYLENNVAELNSNDYLLLDRQEINIIKLILFIVTYCKTVRQRGKYIEISESFVRQSNSVVEDFLENTLGFRLPEAFNEDENYNLRNSLAFYEMYIESLSSD